MASSDPNSPPRATPLRDRHGAALAKLVSFAGWEMPVHYPAGVRSEHLAVRAHAGVFDVSHMGEIETRGPGAVAFLQRLLSNDVGSIAVGGAQYSVMCREDGGVLDDLFTYRLAEDRYLTVTNAANHAKDLAWFEQQVGSLDGNDDVEVLDRASDFAMIAVQGPAARSLLGGIVGGGVEALPRRFRVSGMTVAGADVLVCGTGYTGEDGVEILCAPADAPIIWDATVAAGATPAGLAARDTLRLEVCFHLYGNDLMESRGPVEAGLGWCCKEATGFIGAEAIAAARAAGPDEVLAPFVLTGPGIPRASNAVVGGGEVTSGTFSPSLEVGIGMAYLPAARAEPGAEIEIDVRGRMRGAVVVERPIYRPERS